MNRTTSLLLTALVAATLTACMQEPGAGDVGEQGQEILLGKNVKVDPNLSHWPSKLELINVKSANPTEAPTILSISPTSVSRGQAVGILGTSFSRMTFLGQKYLVDFQAGGGRVSVTANTSSDTQIVALVPFTATTGKVRLINAASGAIWAESPLPLNVILPMPTTGTVRFTNSSQFEVSSLVVNGREQIPVNMMLPPGAAFDVTGPGGMVPWQAALGSGGSVMFTFTGSTTFINGLTNNEAIPRVTANLALTQGQASAQFTGVFWDNLVPHNVTMVFKSNNTWEAWLGSPVVGGVPAMNGTYVDAANPPGSSATAIFFSMRSSNGFEVISIDAPYGQVQVHNGPVVNGAATPIIYTRQ